jgi:mono/diheme cytochrome c family protein
MKYVVTGVFVAGLAVIAWQLMAPAGHRNVASTGETGDIAVPALSETAVAGQSLFAANCAACHGFNAGGGDKGPPLVHPIYNPGHHSDQAFYNAVQHGSRQHHWSFGDMPAQPQLSTDDTALIIDYVRELQVANGITFEGHRM